MKCCALPTISTAADVRPDAGRAAVDATLEAVIFAEVLKPLGAAFGPLGDVVTGTLAQSVTARPRP